MMKKTEWQTVPRFAKKHGVAISTAWRWALTGVKGRKLQTVMVGGRRYVTPESESAFFQQKEEEHQPQPDTLSAEVASKRLDAIFAKKEEPKSDRR